MSQLHKIVFKIRICLFALMSAQIFVQAFPSFGPVGSESGLMGNSGIALSSTSSSGALNPASFYGMIGSRISASSSMLQMSRLNVSSSSQIIDRTEAPQLQLGSAYIFSKQNIAGFEFGVFVSEDQNMKATKYLEMDQFIDGSFQIDFDFELTRIGLIVATNVNDSIFVGITPTIYFWNRSSINLTKTDSGGLATLKQYDKRQQQMLGSLRLGTLIRFESFSLGAFAETSGSMISNSQTLLRSSVESTGAVFDDSNTRPTNEVTPPMLGMGIKLGSKDKFEFLADTIYTFSTDYVDQSESTDPEKQKMKSTKMNQYSIGARWPSEMINGFLSTGIQHSRTYDYSGSSDAHINYLNFGAETKISFVTTYLNFFYAGLKNLDESASTMENFGLSMGTEFSY